MKQGIFTISLDMELYWGIRDEVPLERARQRLLGDREVVPRMLDLFARFDIHATWAVVGFLFFDGRDELMAALPSVRPRYVNRALDPYEAVARLGASEREDPFHFAPSLVKRILGAPNQEIGTHTFSHFYCLEPGQTKDAFRDDIRAAKTAAARIGANVRSIVFPRNQCQLDYLEVCAEEDIIAYRGNPKHWMYRAAAGSDSPLKRGARLLDAFVNVSGAQRYVPPRTMGRAPINVPASRFLRPWNRRLARLRPLQLRRIKNEMTIAAERGALYHLWWHPHNFGLDQTENLAGAREIFEHYEQLRDRHGMKSLAMREAAAEWGA